MVILEVFDSSTYIEGMDRCYVPHYGDIPLVVTINGHDLILVGSSPDIFEGSSLLVGEKQVLRIPESLSHDSSALNSSALNSSAGASSVVESEREEQSDTKRSLESPFAKETSAKENGLDGINPEGEVRNKSSIRCIEVREYNLETLDLITRYSSDNEIPEIPIVGGDSGVPSVNMYEVFEKDRFFEMTRLEQFAKHLAAQSGSGVVFIPAAISLDQLLDELQSQLPWCH